MASKSKVLFTHNVPITDDKGNPSPYFVRQLKILLDEKQNIADTADGALQLDQLMTQLLADLGGDPAANKIVYWDDSTNTFKFLGIGTNLSVSSNTLNATGGSGGGNWWAGHVPLASDFPTSFGTVAPTKTDDADIGLIINGGTPVSGDAQRIWAKSIPTPTGDWTVTARITPTIYQSNFAGAGLYMVDSVANRCIVYGSQTDNRFSIQRRPLPTGFGSLTLDISTLAESVNMTKWVRIQHVAASNLNNYYHSADGKNWVMVLSESDTAYLTNRANYIGLGVNYNLASGRNGFCSCDYWVQTW